MHFLSEEKCSLEEQGVPLNLELDDLDKTATILSSIHQKPQSAQDESGKSMMVLVKLNESVFWKNIVASISEILSCMHLKSMQKKQA